MSTVNAVIGTAAVVGAAASGVGATAFVGSRLTAPKRTEYNDSTTAVIMLGTLGVGMIGGATLSFAPALRSWRGAGLLAGAAATFAFSAIGGVSLGAALALQKNMGPYRG